MASGWYYVEDNQRKGPVSQDDILDLYREGVLTGDSYVWRKGFENWERLSGVDEFNLDSVSGDEDIPDLPPRVAVDLDNLNENEKVFTVKVGPDRDSTENEYGPYSLKLMKKLWEENRINDKTLVFTPGSEDWITMAELPCYSAITGSEPPLDAAMERRSESRKPFVARLFFHDNSEVFEGVCRDISIGGLQVLVSNFPGHVGDTVSMNVHPDNSDFCFVAKGQIVRMLDGGQGFSLRFLNLSRESEAAIRKYVQS